MDSAEEQYGIKLGRVRDLIENLGVNSSTNPGLMFKFQRHLMAYDDDTTYDLIDAVILWNKDQQHPYVSFFHPQIMYDTEKAIRELAYYRVLIPRSIDTTTISNCLHGMHFIDRYRDTQLETLKGTELETVTALIKVTLAIEAIESDELLAHPGFSKNSSFFIRNPDLISFISDHYQQADSIARFIEERRSADLVALSEYLSDATPLKNGNL